MTKVYKRLRDMRERPEKAWSLDKVRAPHVLAPYVTQAVNAIDEALVLNMRGVKLRDK